MSSDILKQTRHGGVLVLSVDNPPARALDHKTRAALIAALNVAEHEADVRAVVLTAHDGAAFAASDDLRRALLPEEAPTLDDLTARVASFGKPVVAALTGRVVGAGAGLAMAAHWRIVAPGTRIGWPDTTLGRVPGGGATQRLPRLVGAQAALDLFLSGRAFPMSKPMLEALVDAEVVGDNLLAGAIEFAASSECTRRLTDTRDIGLRDGAQFSAEVAVRREKTGTAHDDAAAQTVACVEAAILLPIAAGLDFEASVAADCAASPVAHARHRLAIAERRIAAKYPAQSTGPVGIAGYGQTAPGFAIATLDAGQSVRAFGDGAERLKGQVQATYEHAIVRNRMTQTQCDERLARMALVEDAQDLVGCALILVTERQAAGLAWPADVPLAVTEPDFADPAQAVHVVPATPVHVRRLVELRTRDQADQAADVAAALSRMQRIPVITSGQAPPVMARLWAAVNIAADRLVIAGIPPERVDAVMREAGWANLPFLSRDNAGLAQVDGQAEGQAALAELFPAHSLGQLNATLVDAGRTGRVSGAGYYDHSGGKPVPDPSVAVILSDMAEATDPGWRDDLIHDTITAAMANEGARVLGEGCVARASDIDLIAVFGLGLPRDTGGPMSWAEARGMAKTQSLLQRLSAHPGDVWMPHPEWADRIKNGRGFYSAG